jgi:hypothetical protein
LAGEFIRIYQRALAADPNNLAAPVDMAAIDSTMAGRISGGRPGRETRFREAALTKVLSLKRVDRAVVADVMAAGLTISKRLTAMLLLLKVRAFA